MNKALASALIGALGISLAQGAVRMPSIFSDHMVMQRSPETPVWGKAKPGENVRVSLGGIEGEAVADKTGKWRVALDLSRFGNGPFEMTVTGENRLVMRDVLVGEVWLASGQSNMAFELSSEQNAAREAARSPNPLLRQFRCDLVAKPSPADDCPGSWTVAAPETVGGFSAVAYYFGRKIQRELNMPVGVLNISWGGTFSEAWTSREALYSVESLKRGDEERLSVANRYPVGKKAFGAGMESWLERTKRQDPGSPHPETYAGMDISTDGWTRIHLPGKVQGEGLPEYGVLWVRREVNVPASVVETTPVKLMLGILEGFDATYWNGEKIEETSYRNFPGDPYHRYYKLPREKIHVGRNVLAVRIFAPLRPAEFKAPSLRFWLGPIPLEGEWLAKAEASLPHPEPTDVKSAPVPPTRLIGAMGSQIFNGMVHPFVPYGIGGVIWYQGESNAPRAWQYRTAFPLLINDWRRQWNKPELPFYFCQLANYLPKKNVPAESNWAELREAQNLALALPQTGQAVLIDAGEEGDIHPRDKETPGERLAAIALARHYGKNIPFSGPVFRSYQIEGDKVRVTFAHAESGLVVRPLPETYFVKSILNENKPLVANSPGSEVEGFAICGEDRQWVWAQARIEGESIVVWSDKVPHPMAVRYAWADNPTCNLYNRAGFPASPFRTDDFPPVTLQAEYGPKS